MAPQSEETQFEKFDSTIAKISDNINSGKVDSTEIYEEIKKELEKELHAVCEEWKNSNFDPNFRFKLSFCNLTIETTLLHSAIDCKEKEAACIPLVRCLLD